MGRSSDSRGLRTELAAYHLRQGFVMAAKEGLAVEQRELELRAAELTRKIRQGQTTGDRHADMRLGLCLGEEAMQKIGLLEAEMPQYVGQPILLLAHQLRARTGNSTTAQPASAYVQVVSGGLLRDAALVFTAKGGGASLLVPIPTCWTSIGDGPFRPDTMRLVEHNALCSPQNLIFGDGPPPRTMVSETFACRVIMGDIAFLGYLQKRYPENAARTAAVLRESFAQPK